MTDPVSTAILTCSSATLFPPKVSPPISRDTVNPIPPSRATPVRSGQVKPFCNGRLVSFEVRNVATPDTNRANVAGSNSIPGKHGTDHRRRDRPDLSPDSIVAGLYRDGTLVIAGRSVPLTTAQSRSLAAVLTPASADHPWPDTIGSNRFNGGRDRVALTKVEPTVVAEVTTDSATRAASGDTPSGS